MTTQTITDKDVSDAYLYFLSRLLVLRQQQLDFQEGFKWNALVHRKPGEVDWPNPNLDVAYSEAWVAVDEKSCLVVSVPKITGRYYTVQFLNGWGETVANINERVFPQHPNGEFAICLKGSQVPVPAGAPRIDVPVKYMRVLSRVELGPNWDDAVALQRQFEFRAIGQPVLPTIPKTPIFDIEGLLGVEAFEAAELALDSEADINPGAHTMHFPKDQLPSQHATYFWSVIAVDSVHRRVLPNPLKRYLLNKESKLQYGQNGSLTLYFSDAKPKEAPDGNWLPTPKGIGYSLTFRFYRPKGAVAQRTYFPPPLMKT